MHCPKCYSRKIKKNGFTHYGKQNHKCLECERQFVKDTDHYISSEKRLQIRRCLSERLSLCGICRIFKVSFTWLYNYAKQVWAEAPDSLGCKAAALEAKSIEELQEISIQADEVWTFCGQRLLKQWLWIAYDPWNRQGISYHLGDRSAKSARTLWNKLPVEWQDNCWFDTDDWKAYKKVIPCDRHFVSKALTQRIERFNNTLRQRCSRLVRKTLSFSKCLRNHEAAIKYFFWQFNLEQQALHL